MLKFIKMQGLGNDYVYVDCVRQPIPANPAELAQKISNRNFGVGGDGLILVCPSDKADARMRMFNADGSESEMCGNGVRCVAKLVYDHGIAKKTRLTIETGRGVLTLDLEIEGGKTRRVKVDMGEPILEAAKIPTTLAGNPPVEAEVVIDGKAYSFTCVSMGNPHAVTFVEEFPEALIRGVGPKVETHSAFPRKTNVEFVRVDNRGEYTMRVWERGSGETLACGTGACAVLVAGVLTGRLDRKVTGHLRGGDLLLEWDEATNHVFMTGPAVEVFEGTWPH